MLRQQFGTQPGQFYQPFSPRQQYDYLGLQRSQQGVEASPEDLGRMHGSSQFKMEDHPNRYVHHQGKLIDTLTGRTSDEFTEEDWMRVIRNAPQQLRNPMGEQ
tara:strand:+ start:171 stop:479 length:309 start_codon:yes stop_codon:yes gene_type:complete